MMYSIFALSFFDEASKNPDSLSFSAKNGLDFFQRLSFFGLEFFENAQKISLTYNHVWVTERGKPITILA